MKTVRFTVVTQKCGRPEAVSLWTKPEEDRAFMRAVKQDRVLTIMQEPGAAKKDYGVVGFVEERHAAYLVFPKSLKAFHDYRIVGIKYDLVQLAGPLGKPVSRRILKRQTRPHPKKAKVGLEPLTAGPSESLSRFARAASQSPGRRPPPAPGKADKRFAVTLRFQAIAELTVEVEADSREDAREKAPKLVQVPDFSKAVITRKTVKIREAD